MADDRNQAQQRQGRGQRETAHGGSGEPAQGAAENASRLRDNASRIADEAAEHGSRQAERIGKQSAELIDGIAQASATVMRGMREISDEWLALTQEGMQKSVDGASALTRCRSFPDLISIQGDLARESVERLLETQRRISEITMRVAGEMSSAAGKHEPDRPAP